jgi:hypothetical protein
MQNDITTRVFRLVEIDFDSEIFKNYVFQNANIYSRLVEKLATKNNFEEVLKLLSS